MPPALHGLDIFYTFYNGPNSSAALPSIGIPVPDQSVAEALQKYIVSFTTTGVTSTSSNNNTLPVFPQWGDDKNLLDLNVTGIKVVKDDTANSRCAWWQKALYY